MAVEERVILLGRVALAIASCDSDQLDQSLVACSTSVDAARDLPDAILQGIPYSGFPGAIDALGRWARLVEQPAAPAHGSSRSPVARSGGRVTRDVGRDNFERVYGAQSDRVLGDLRTFAPALESWILEFAYGTVMSDGLELFDIEALGVASLLGQARRRPLHSHLRGAVRVGWDPEELREFVERLSPWCDNDLVAHAIDVIAGLDREGA